MSNLRTIFIFYFIATLVFLASWVMNVIKLTDCDFEASYKAEVIHIVGVFTPTCIVTGWVDVGK